MLSAAEKVDESVSVGTAVASDTRGPRFESQHWGPSAADISAGPTY